jgi:hypothetical protein
VSLFPPSRGTLYQLAQLSDERFDQFSASGMIRPDLERQRRKALARLLIASKGELPPGEFLAMIESDLPFGPRTAQMLMKIEIALAPRLANTKHVSLFPPSWGTLYQLAQPDHAGRAQLIEPVIREFGELVERHPGRRQKVRMRTNC